MCDCYARSARAATWEGGRCTPTGREGARIRFYREVEERAAQRLVCGPRTSGHVTESYAVQETQLTGGVRPAARRVRGAG
jgi:hypothetical protein